MFENPRRGKQARNFTTNVPKILDLESSSEQIFSKNWSWVPLSESRTESYKLDWIEQQLDLRLHLPPNYTKWSLSDLNASFLQHTAIYRMSC